MTGAETDESFMPASTERQVGEVARRLVELHLDFVWRSLRYLGITEPDREDACQRVWLVVTKNALRIRPGKEKSYIFSVVVRIAKEARRGRRPGHEPLEEHPLQAGTPSPEQQCDRGKARALLNELLVDLNQDQRTVFALFEIEGLSTPEIAEALGVSRGTVASRLRLARDHFQRKLDRYQSQYRATRESHTRLSGARLEAELLEGGDDE